MDWIERLTADVNWTNVTKSGLRIFFVLVVVWVLVKVLTFLLSRLEKKLVGTSLAAGEIPGEATKRAETLSRLVRQALVITLWVVALVIILEELGVKIGAIIASLGVVGLALGFGAQNLVRDVISGFFFILENQVRVGDTAVVNGTEGLVEAMNFRTIVLRDGAGTVHIFPNGTITTLANKTKGWSAYVFTIGIGYREDTDRAVQVMRAAAEELRQTPGMAALLAGDVEVFGVEALADSAVHLKGRIKTLPGKQAEVGREYLRLLKRAFERAGIEIPYPQLAIQLGDSAREVVERLAVNAEGGTARG